MFRRLKVYVFSILTVLIKYLYDCVICCQDSTSNSGLAVCMEFVNHAILSQFSKKHIMTLNTNNRKLSNHSILFNLEIKFNPSF